MKARPARGRYSPGRRITETQVFMTPTLPAHSLVTVYGGHHHG